MIFYTKNSLIIILLFFSNTLPSQVTWQKKHSPNESVHTIDVSSNNTIYAATSSYGIFKSENEGVTWDNISLGLPDSIIRELKLSTDEKIFVGTGSHGVYQYSNGNWSAINNGLPTGTILTTSFVKGINGHMYMMSIADSVYSWNGVKWNNITYNLPQWGRKLAMSTSGVLYAGVFNSGVYAYDGINNNWTIVGDPMTNKYVTKIVVSANDTIYAVCNSNNIFRCHTSGGIWTSIQSGLPAVDMTFIASDVQNRIYTGSSSGNGQIYRSVNNGNTWSPLVNDLYTTAFGCIVFSLSGNIYTGASGIFKSLDGGLHWSDLNAGLDAPRSIFCFKACRNGTLFVGTRIGPWRSVDNGLSWQLRNIGVAHFNVLQITENAAGDILFHAYNSQPKGAIYRSVNNGDNWTQVAANGCDLYTKIKQHKADTLWASSRFSGTTTLSYSVNNGATWNNNPLMISAIWDIDVSKDNTIFVGSETEGVSRSDNGGQSFILGVGNSIPWYGNVLEIELDENGTIFAGSDWWTHSLWYSEPTQNGNIWTQFTDPDLTVRGIQDLIFDIYNNIYLACEDGGVRMAYNTIWNATTNWIQSSVGLPSATANILELNFDTLGYLYAIGYTNNGHNGGLFKSNLPVNPPASSVYTFMGSGDWNIASNWEGNRIAPTTLSGNKFIIIDPPTNGECILITPLQLSDGATLKVRPNKVLRLAD